MANHDLSKWEQSHDFSSDNTKSGKATKNVIFLTVITMIIEIVAGTKFGSMALLADGWHMGTHAAALCITLFAYYYADKHAKTGKYTFGTGKVGILGGYSSAIVLAIVSFHMFYESLHRIVNPEIIQFDYALIVAVIGLLVNGFSTFLLHDDHGHHHDHNLKAAYFHVLADALTSVFAIVALLFGKYMGWVVLDPIMGVVGAIVILVWSWGLIKDTGFILLDGGVDQRVLKDISTAIESIDDTEICDFHVWRLGNAGLSVVVSVVTHSDRDAQFYKEQLKELNNVAHFIIEVNKCTQSTCRDC